MRHASLFPVVASLVTSAFLLASPLARPQTASTSTTKNAATKHMSLHDFNALSVNQRTNYAGTYIEKVIADVKPTHPQLASAIYDYFFVTPPGKDMPLGAAAFGGLLTDKDQLAKEGKLDLNKEFVEGVILDIIKREVIPTVGHDNAKHRSDPAK
jgi:hypothetical protein